MKVYKFRSNSDERILKRDITTFQENKFYAPNFNDLNDPFEANFIESIKESTKILESIFNVKTSEINKAFQEVRSYKEKLGIFSLSKTYLSEQMWAYYANSNKGYCIEYDLDKISERTQIYDLAYNFDISYESSIPIIEILDINNSNSIIKKMFGTKKDLWGHEYEHRIIFDTVSLKKHHESAITGIYFSYQAEENLIKSFEDNFGERDITFHKIFPNFNTHNLESKVISKFSKKLKYNLNRYRFELVFTKNDSTVLSYYIYVKNNYSKNELQNLGIAFLEKYCFKPSNIFFLNSNKIINLINKYPKTNDELIIWAEAVIAEMPYDCNNEIFMTPFKDWYYKDLKKK